MASVEPASAGTLPARAMNATLINSFFIVTFLLFSFHHGGRRGGWCRHVRGFTTRFCLLLLRRRLVSDVSPDTAALLGHIVVLAKTVLAGRPFHNQMFPAAEGFSSEGSA